TVGWGLGLDLGHTSPGSIDFTAGIRRLSGGSASFSRVVNDAGDVARYSAATNYMLYTLGVTGSFGGPI
ncbi:MAG TPA: hypothetical protein VHW01_04945, partial [Polyangiaceae bacterium]|nr:hypothetical protein [Polyangiaceae bacterium]